MCSCSDPEVSETKKISGILSVYSKSKWSSRFYFSVISQREKKGEGQLKRSLNFTEIEYYQRFLTQLSLDILKKCLNITTDIKKKTY